MTSIVSRKQNLPKVPENHNTSHRKASCYILAVMFAVSIMQFASKQSRSALLILFPSLLPQKLCQLTTLQSKKIRDLHDVMPF
jgi:hypothetical protein